ncbi:hypothetical protein MMC14_001932 [Varicellaria rhodocarpa]|nr:hypothetical protein [Varicellaria rhodocarpa]
MSIIPPNPPDFHVCDNIYGANLLYTDCIAATMNPVLHGSQALTYTIGAGPGYNMPFTVSSGGCYITIDVAGPNKPTSVRASPDFFLGSALWVIARCVVVGFGTGGFATASIRNIINFSTNIDNLVTVPYPPSTAFYTVLVGNLHSVNKRPGVPYLNPLQANSLFTPPLKNIQANPSPPDTDPAIPIEIAAYNLIQFQFSNLSPASLERRVWAYNADSYHRQSLASARGSPQPWYTRAIAAAEDTMTYECDAGLGNPAVEDCSQIRWDQVKPGGDSLAVAPGKGVFLHQNTCTLAITASLALTLTWAQIQTALSALLGLCVANPSQDTPQGGRAYYSPPAPALNDPQQNNGKQHREEKRDGAPLSGLNALPPHANITIFQQKSTFQNDASAEEKTCAWGAVVKGESIAQACGGGGG